MRDDVARPSLDRETVLEGAPKREGSYFRVPRIIGEEA
jgi:Asp-tRNA(Asn)/Glu-tRNA(Gln) amidotransferase C subunit